MNKIIEHKSNIYEIQDLKIFVLFYSQLGMDLSRSFYFSASFKGSS